MSAGSLNNETNNLETSLSELEAFFRDAPAGLAVLDDQLRYVNVNQYLANLNRTSIENHLGCTPQEVYPGLGRKIEADLRQVLATGQPLLDQELSTAVPGHPNTVFYGLASYFPNSIEGHTVGVGLVLVDVTGCKLAEQALRRAKEAADVAAQAKLGFLAGVSHELRTSLNTILGFSKLMGRDSSKPAEQQRYTTIITRSAEHLLALINDAILDTSETENNRVESTPTSAEPDPYRRVLGLAAGQPNFRLLVADDEAVTRQLLAGILQPLGFEIRTVANSQKAFEVWQTWQPHLIFFDTRLHDPAGEQVARQIKAAATTPVALIALTTGELDQSSTSLFDDMLHKPLAYRDILAILEQHLGAEYDYLEAGQVRAEGPVTDETSPSPQMGLAEPLVEPEGTVNASSRRRNEDRIQAGQSPPTFDSTHLRTQLAEFSPGLVADLHQAVVDLDVERLRGLLREIRTKNEPLAANLLALVDNFAYDELFSVTTSGGDE